MANDTVVSRYLPDGRPYLNIDTAKTLTVADSGLVQNVIADAIAITLPTSSAATVSQVYTVRNGGVATATGGPTGATSNGTVLVNLKPVAADGFSGNAFTAAVNKGAQNTKITARVGDEITVEGSGITGVTAWLIAKTQGIWVREA